MKLAIYFSFFLFALALVSACGGSGPDSQTGDAESNNSAGAPEAVANVTPGLTPTPGIPANGRDAMNVPRGATPTPGIPDQETIRRQMETRNVDVNAVNRPSTTAPNSNTNAKTADPLGRPRRTNSN